MSGPSTPSATLTTSGQFVMEQLACSSALSQVTDHIHAMAAAQARGAGTKEMVVTQLSTPSVKAMVLAALYHRLKDRPAPFVVVCPDPQTTSRYLLELPIYLPDVPLIRYPLEGDNPYELTMMPAHSLRDYYRATDSLDQGQPGIYLLTPKSLVMRHPTPEDRHQNGLELAVDDDLDPDTVVMRLVAMGYNQTGMVMERGDFSRRGDILDIYPVNEQALRISFFGETIESIKLVDIESQRSVSAVESLLILPRSELVLTPERRGQLQEMLQERLQHQSGQLSDTDFEGLSATVENQLTALEQDFWPDGIDYYAPLVHPDYGSITQRIPEDAVLVYDDWAMALNQLEGLSDRLENQYTDGVSKGRLLDIGVRHHISAEEAMSNLNHIHRRVMIDSLPTPELSMGEANLVPITIEGPHQFQANLAEAAEQFRLMRNKGLQVVITTDYPQRVLDACQEHDVPSAYWAEGGTEVQADTDPTQWWPHKEIIVSKQGPIDGFSLPGLNLIHFSDTELFGRRRLKRALMEGPPKRSKDDVDVIQSLNELRPGDYVVHFKHGIGQFVEITQIKMEHEVREYLTIQYSGTDRLHVPVDQLNLLARYRGSGDKPPKLSKMGGVEWSKVKKKVKKSIQSIAKDLVQLYATREKITGYMFEQDSPWQVEMEEAFPFTETPDQWTAIQAMKGDMESDKPMDRLICGDVGFGKTEVAMRGLFKCVLSNKQAAVLVPTTILAQQHFNTICERFKAYPVKIGLLSRFRSAKEQREVCKRLSEGDVDIVVGTHRLLQKDVVFKDLGLLVIDEEHRFGVAHKEKIKQIRTKVDVLTLSATPIPRTLHMALSGVRDMSLIKTPPTNRLPIQTFVGPYNPAQIRVAMLQEMDRGGQIYFVHNRVQTIYQMAEQLKNLVPEASFCVGHGQMSENDLENVMLEFSQGNYDVLLATTIIESGVDIPNVNTMIIDRADRFGLAQLYQLRGRVGRSEVQAYCYLYYDPERNLTDDARNRLRAIREFTSLGSGYQIALRDMEIRGVGNILGGEQHGHMIAVGYDMYCDMLKEAVDALQTGQTLEEDKEPSVIDLNVTAFIPQKWVGDRDVKLNEYKRLANINSERGLEVIMAEWQDRFGDIPAETMQLVNLARLRIMATLLDIPLVRCDDEDYLRISVSYGLQEWLKIQAKLPAKLGKKLRWVAAVATRSDSKPTLLCRAELMDGAEQVKFLLDLFKALMKIAGIERKGDSKSTDGSAKKDAEK